MIEAMTQHAHLTGQTKDAGFQIGVRKTFPIPAHLAWQLVTSPAGLKIWLGEAPLFRLETGQPYQTLDGTQGEVRVVRTGDYFRLTWQPPEWQRASTIQVRLLPKGGKTVISFHQEQLAGEPQREQMRLRWQQALEELYALVVPPRE
jgi:uncharacterized protein YndB with AHSA1/START domain